MTPLADYLLRLIEGWRAAIRAASSDDYADDFRPGYERRAEAYALCIRTNARRLQG